MASRDETVRFVYDIVGDNDVAAAVVTMLKAADAGKVAEADILAFAAAFKTAAEQAKLADQAISQKAGIADLTTQLNAAKAGLAQLSAEFDRTDTSSRKVNAAFASADAQIASLTAQIASESLALQKAEGTLQKFGVDTANLATESTRLKQVANENAVALAGLGTASKQASAGFTEIAEKSTLLSRVVDQVKALVAAFAGLFVLSKAKDAIEGILDEGDKAAKFGTEFAAAFGGVQAGADALTKVREIAESVPLALDDVTAAALRAKKQGLDPFDGTLTALINVNAKFGGSVDTLNTLIDTLGKAANKGQIDLRALTTLQQQGIPAAQLLGQAMGKTADEILALAKSGQLGKDAVQTLIQALAQSGSGAATAQLGLLSGLTQKLHDQWQEFLELIANSGAYQFVQQQLQNLNASIKQGIADGSLAKAAQAISDAIVGIGRAVVGTTQFLIEHATAIGVAVKGYVLFKSTLLAIDLAGAAQRMLALGTATKVAGDAAAGAAEAGGFAKLSAAINRIPKAIQIGITVAAVDFALTRIEDLIEAENEFYATQQKQKDLDKELADQRESNLAKAATLTAKLQQFADVQIESADELREKNKQQTDAYIEQLQQATRFYEALRIQQQQAGDVSGVAASTEKLKQIGIALQDAQSHVKDLADGLKTTSDQVAAVVDKFDKLKTAGTSAAEAISGAFSGIDFKTPQGLQSALDIIQQVSIRSQAAKDAVGSELVDALSKLDAADLALFQKNVVDVLGSAKGNAETLQVALGASLQASLLSLGLSAAQAGVQITATGEKILATFDNIKNNAIATGQQIGLAFSQALSQASTEGEVHALLDELTAAFNAGKIGAQQFEQESEAAGRKIAEIKIAADTASAGLDGMGKAGQTAAQTISGSLQDARDALIVQENALSSQLTAALAANDQTLSASLNAQIKEVAAQVDSYNTKIRQLQDIPPPPPPDLSGLQQGLQQGVNAVHQYETGVQGITFTNKEAADAFEELGGSAGALGPVLSELQGFYDQFSAHSTAAVNKFTAAMKQLFEGGGNFSAQAIADSTNIIRLGEAAAQAGALVSAQIAQQQVGVQELADQYENLSDSALEAMAKAKGGNDQLLNSLQGDAAAARAGRSAFDLLGAADLSQLASALDAAAQKVEQLKQQAEQAQDALQNLGSSLQDQIDELTGNLTDEEDRRFQQQLKDIQDQAKIAGTLNTSAYDKLVEQAKLLHELKLKQIAEEQAAQNAGGGGNGAPPATPSGPAKPGGPGGGQSGGGGAGIPSGGINFAPVFNATVFDKNTQDAFAKQLFLTFQEILRRSK